MNENATYTKSRKKPGEGADAQRVRDRIKDFDPANSIACKTLKSKFGDGITHNELRDIAILISKIIKVGLDRDAKRDDRVLHKWFDENWDVIEPILNNITIYDANHEIIQ